LPGRQRGGDAGQRLLKVQSLGVLPQLHGDGVGFLGLHPQVGVGGMKVSPPPSHHETDR
jgi:hypothetical protein